MIGIILYVIYVIGIILYVIYVLCLIYALLSLGMVKKRIQKATNYDQLNYAKIEFEKAKKHVSWLFILCTIFQITSGAIVNYSAEWGITWGPCVLLGVVLPSCAMGEGDKRIKQREQELRGSTNNSTKN